MPYHVAPLVFVLCVLRKYNTYVFCTFRLKAQKRAQLKFYTAESLPRAENPRIQNLAFCEDTVIDEITNEAGAPSF